MNRQFGIFIVVGLLFGAVLGVFLGAAAGNTSVGLAFGALAGVFIGWFAAAVVLENRDRQKSSKP